MDREKHIENFRLAGIFMMFMMTILMVLLAYRAWAHDGVLLINVHPAEANFEAFVIFPLVIFFSVFTLAAELVELARKHGVYFSIRMMIMIMVFIVLFLFSNTDAFRGR